MPTTPVNITLGTAGHIDHGKTALVKLLTGCDTDRLKEEKERGMSIDLGHAPCVVSDLQVGIVDVPGHERFVKTMVAGATGIDGVILVVAADDGVMPQTREHLDILTLLGVEHGIVALTKIDRVAPDHAEVVRHDVEVFLQGTFLGGAPTLPISSLTGDGFDEFYKGLAALVGSIVPKEVSGVFRLPVDRTFSVKGYGTVVTGIPVAGSTKVGDEVVLLPQQAKGRISAIEVYGHASEAALAGQCAALNVRQWEHGTIRRGDTVAVPGYFSPAQWYACELRLLQHEKLSLRNGMPVKFHTGTSESGARVFLMKGDEVRGGEGCVVQVRLNKRLVAGPGDRFIVRSVAPVATIGGGTIVEAMPGKVKRTRRGVVEDLEARAEAVRDERSFVEYCVKKAAGNAASSEEISLRAKIPVGRTGEILDELVRQGSVLRVPPRHFMHAATALRASEAVLALLDDFHQRSPQSPGLLLEDLRDCTGLPKGILDAVVKRLRGEGRVAERSGRLALAGHTQAFSDEERKRMEQVESLLRTDAFHPPSLEEAASATGLALTDIEKTVGLLVEDGRLVRVAPQMFFHRDAVEKARGLLVEHIRKEGKLESVKFKYMLETTRKYALPLLDYFDTIGVTMRVHNTRYLKTPKGAKGGGY